MHGDGGPVCQHPPRRPVDDGGEEGKAFGHRDVSHIHCPDLIGTDDDHVAQGVGINALLGMLLAGVGVAVQRFDPHLLHQCADVLRPNLMSFSIQHVAQHPSPSEEVLQMNFIILA